MSLWVLSQVPKHVPVLNFEKEWELTLSRSKIINFNPPKVNAKNEHGLWFMNLLKTGLQLARFEPGIFDSRSLGSYQFSIDNHIINSFNYLMKIRAWNNFGLKNILEYWVSEFRTYVNNKLEQTSFICCVYFQISFHHWSTLEETKKPNLRFYKVWPPIK